MDTEISNSYPPLINQNHVSRQTNNKYLYFTLLGIIIIIIIFSLIITFIKK